MSYRDYWTTQDVPAHTGAVNANGVDDLREVLAALHVDLSGQKVVDVGCGTGRLSELCGDYIGVDIAPSQVEYAKSKGLHALLIDGPEDLTLYESSADTVCCFSVFTHISREDRQAYLHAFTELAPRVVVDILPGDQEHGDIPAWYTPASSFETDLVDAGFSNFDSCDRRSADGHLHRYYVAW